MRYLWLIAGILTVAVLSVRCRIPAADLGPPLPVLENLEAAVLYPTVRIQVQDGFNGTGVVVNWDGQTARVLTAAHLFPDLGAHQITVFMIEPTPWGFSADWVWQAGNADLALLEGEPAPGLIPAVAELAAGINRFDPVIAVGVPPGQNYLVPSSGWIAELDPPLTTSTAWFGSSGGPVFVKQEGRWKLWAVISGIPRTSGHGVVSWITGLTFVTPINGWLGDING